MNPTASTGRCSHHVRGQHVDPATDDRLAPLAQQGWDGELGTGGRQVDVARGERVPNGRLGIPRPVVPVARPQVQPAHVGGPLVVEVGAQHVGEQVVVPVPLAVRVERDDEQVLPLQRLQRRPSARPAGHRVAQRPGQPVEHRGVEQEPAHALRQPVEHLVAEVVDDEPVVAGEPAR